MAAHWMNRWLSAFSVLVWAASGGGSTATADVFTHAGAIPELSGYSLVYTLPIPNSAAYNTNTIPYSVDNRADAGTFDRIAYYMELDSGSGLEWVYVSMDAFTADRGQIGVPSRGPNGSFTNAAESFQQLVANMNVFTNVPAKVTPGIGLSTGNIEFWSTNYGTGNAIGIPNASGSAFDFGDAKSSGSDYGSMQIHNHDIDGGGTGTAGQTIMAYNRWGSGAGELGIGNAPGTHTDWTFTDNRLSYSTKNLQVLVHPALASATELTSGPDFQTNAPEAATYAVVYELPIDDGAFNASQYTIDNTALFSGKTLARVGYYLELDGPRGPQYAYVSMDAFTQTASELGVPADGAVHFQQIVDNLFVASNVSSVTSGSFANGNVEFWAGNYGGAPGLGGIGGTGAYDFNDTRTTTAGYGSMQIHNYGQAETIIAYNHWRGGVPDLGIGNDPNTARSNYNPDWTFANQTSGYGANQYTVKNLWVLAELAGAQLTSSSVGDPLDFGNAILAHTPVTISDAVTFRNTGDPDTIISVTGFELTGADPALFDVPDFDFSLLYAGFSGLDEVLFDVSFRGAGYGNYSAQLTFHTSEGDVSFNLAAAVVPEPSTLALLFGLAVGGLMGWTARRRRGRR